MNKKIVFGIILFCAISFIAYTFANPMENEQGNLGGSNGTTVGGNENSGKPTENEPTQTPTEPEKPAEETKEPTTPVGPIAETVDVSKITASQTSYTLKRGEKVQLNATVLPSNATDKTLTYKSNNISVATVSSNGLVTARAVGGTTIIITSNNGKTARVTINVISNQTTQEPSTPQPDPVVEVSKIELNTAINSGALVNGKTMQINVTVIPANAENKTVRFESNNTNVVTVDENGLVSTVGPGVATITVTANNGVKQTIPVTVIENVKSTMTVEKQEIPIPDCPFYVAKVKIQVPSSYTKEMIKNMKIVGEKDNIGFVLKYADVQNIDKISSNEAYVLISIDVPKTLKGTLPIKADWVGSGHPITYEVEL